TVPSVRPCRVDGPIHGGAAAFVGFPVAHLQRRARASRDGEGDEWSQRNEGVEHDGICRKRRDRASHQYGFVFSAAFSIPLPAALMSAPAPAIVLQPAATTANPTTTHSAAIFLIIILLLFPLLHESTDVDEVPGHGGGRRHCRDRAPYRQAHARCLRAAPDPFPHRDRERGRRSSSPSRATSPT